MNAVGTARPAVGSSAFVTDYDLASRRAIRPRGRSFELVVTPRFAHHYLTESYEGLTADLLGSLLAHRRLFVDVGAHCGFFTLLAATRHPALRVVALEPVDESRELLLEGIERNGVGARVLAVPAAASDHVGHATLHISQASDNCSLDPHPHPTTATIGTRQVATTTLDALLVGHPDAGTAVIKIDTDGHELAVLDGLAATLASAEDARLLVELNPKMLRLAGHEPEALLQRLFALGYQVFLVDDPGRRFLRLPDPASWRLGCAEGSYANLYCVPRDRGLSLAAFAHSAQLNGAERTLLGNLTLSVEDGGAVCTVVLPEDGPLRRRLDAVGVATIVAPLPWWCGLEPRDPSEIPALLSAGCDTLARDVLPALARAAPDLVESMTLTAPWGAVAAEILGLPHVWQVSEHGEADHRLRFFTPFDEVRRAVAEHSDLVLTASEGVRQALFGDLAATNALPMDRWIGLPRRSPRDPAAGSAARVRRIAVVGTLSEGKDQLTVVKALRALREAGIASELLLAGAAVPRYRERLQETARSLQVADHVHLLGYVEDVGELMLDADVVVSAAPREAFGRSALEAAAEGRAVVCARGSGPAEVLRDGEHALWFEGGDAEDLAVKLALLLRDAGLARRLGENARRLVAARFSRQRVSARRHELLTMARVSRATSSVDPVMRLVHVAQDRLAREVTALGAARARAESALAAERAASSAAREREAARQADLQAEIDAAARHRSNLRSELAAAVERARAFEETTLALVRDRDWMKGSSTWRWRVRALAWPGVAALYRTLRSASGRLAGIGRGPSASGT